MAETVISLTKIIKLPLGTGVSEDLSRLWIPVTEQNGNDRKTVRVPFPVGDYEVACEYCNDGMETCPTCGGTGIGAVCDHCGGTGKEPVEPGPEPTDPCDSENPNPDNVCTVCHADSKYRVDGVYHLPCETCNGSGAIECTHCHGLGLGVMTVSPNGIIQLRYDDKVFDVNTSGLTIKVDGETIKIGENGLEVNSEAIVPPNAYLSTGELKTESFIVVPKNTSIFGHNMTVDTNGRIYANADNVRGFSASLTVDITNTNFENNTQLIPYHVEVLGGTDEWDLMIDTTHKYSGFVVSTLVTENTTSGIQFKVTKTLERGEALPTGYQEEFSLDVHSF